MSITELLKMEGWEYNHWLGYLLLEQEEQQEQLRKARHK